jgi:hypothetical protein
MKPKLDFLVASLMLATTSSALATVRYVNVNNANAVGSRAGLLACGRGPAEIPTAKGQL